MCEGSAGFANESSYMCMICPSLRQSRIFGGRVSLDGWRGGEITGFRGEAQDSGRAAFRGP